MCLDPVQIGAFKAHLHGHVQSNSCDLHSRLENIVSCHRVTGYICLCHRNWHCGKKELDIVAEYRNELIVIEVKTRKNTRFGNPEDAVTDKKIRRIIASTDAYLRKFSVDLPVRFDIITLVGEKAPFTIEHIEEAFYPPIW